MGLESVASPMVGRLSQREGNKLGLCYRTSMTRRPYHDDVLTPARDAPMLYRHAGGLEEWMAFFADPEAGALADPHARMIAIMAQVHPGEC